MLKSDLPLIEQRQNLPHSLKGNHGKDVKEYYFYLDSARTHSYMKYLYKYPQATYPYEDLIERNRFLNNATWD